MRPRYPRLKRACYLATLALFAIWLLSGFIVININHVRIGQGTVTIIWGAPVKGYGIHRNNADFCTSTLWPEYETINLPPPRPTVHWVEVPLMLLGMCCATVHVLLRRFVEPVDPKMCQACGYSLTGNTSGICPECGTAIERSPTA